MWSAAEDRSLYNNVQKYGPKNWDYIASFITGRSAKQCRERYHNHVDPALRKGHWTAQEDEIIIQKTREIGFKWATIAKSLVGRADNDIKNRYNRVLKKRFENTEEESSCEITTNHKENKRRAEISSETEESSEYSNDEDSCEQQQQQTEDRNDDAVDEKIEMSKNNKQSSYSSRSKATGKVASSSQLSAARSSLSSSKKKRNSSHIEDDDEEETLIASPAPSSPEVRKQTIYPQSTTNTSASPLKKPKTELLPSASAILSPLPIAVPLPIPVAHSTNIFGQDIYAPFVFTPKPVMMAPHESTHPGENLLPSYSSLVSEIYKGGWK
eukprot:c13357_g1_i3.p1 GENE.c13357_g1_i3~~c13357_g1_i3.p1  ORF type:complete len:360 (+),score=88.79 c13357_g1_i3:105-1082(+)